MNVLVYLMELLHLTLTLENISENSLNTYSSNKTKTQNHISTAEDFPFHVLIVYGNSYCSGALIRSQIVVTTASCFVKRTHQKIYVKVGVDTITSQGQILRVVELKIHEYYKHTSSANNDIALLVLEGGLMFSDKVKKLTLIQPGVALSMGTPIEVSGWGHKNLPSKCMNSLIWSNMVTIIQDDCIKCYDDLITSSSYCARYQYDRRLSDNGGPAVFKNCLVGLLSFGGTGTLVPFVAVFTNVSYFHRWITLNSQIFLKKYCKTDTCSSDE